MGSQNHVKFFCKRQLAMTDETWLTKYSFQLGLCHCQKLEKLPSRKKNKEIFLIFNAKKKREKRLFYLYLLPPSYECILHPLPLIRYISSHEKNAVIDRIG